MDAAGKDSTIRAVLTGVNPAGCQVFSFKQPSKEELESGTGLEEEDEARKYRIFPIQIQNVEQDEVKH